VNGLGDPEAIVGPLSVVCGDQDTCLASFGAGGVDPDDDSKEIVASSRGLVDMTCLRS
jgi:hypothetical protein